MQIVRTEVHVAPRLEDEANPAEEKKGNKNASDEEDQPVVEFEDQSYELAQTYQLEDEYQDMTAEQEARGATTYTVGTSRIPGNDKITPMTGRNGKENDGAVTHCQGENES